MSGPIELPGGDFASLNPENNDEQTNQAMSMQQYLSQSIRARQIERAKERLNQRIAKKKKNKAKKKLIKRLKRGKNK